MSTRGRCDGVGFDCGPPTTVMLSDVNPNIWTHGEPDGLLFVSDGCGGGSRHDREGAVVSKWQDGGWGGGGGESLKRRNVQ